MCCKHPCASRALAALWLLLGASCAPLCGRLSLGAACRGRGAEHRPPDPTLAGIPLPTQLLHPHTSICILFLPSPTQAVVVPRLKSTTLGWQLEGEWVLVDWLVDGGQRMPTGLAAEG